MKEYSIDVPVFVTLYIRAENEKEAQAKAEKYAGTFNGPKYNTVDIGRVEETDPDIKISEVGTMHGVRAGDTVSKC